MIVGAALLVFGFIGGRRARRRHPGAGGGAIAAAAEPKPVCACKHALAFHDPRTNVCHGQINGDPLRYDSFHHATAWKRVQCTCRQYVGPIPADQVLANFTLTHGTEPPTPDGDTSDQG